MKTITILLLPLLLLALPFTSTVHAAAEAEPDPEAVTSIIEDFSRVKNLSESRKRGAFSISPFHGETADKVLSDAEKKAITRCRDKYQITVREKTQSLKREELLYIYCYDNKAPKLLLEKKLTGK